HQNQSPLCSCQGRKITGICCCLPCASVTTRPLLKATNASRYFFNTSCRAPPGTSSCSAGVLSQESPPDTGLYTCQLRVITPPRLKPALIHSCICWKLTPSRFLSFPNSRPPSSHPYTAGFAPVTSRTSDLSKSPSQFTP